jgi:Bacterial SH3 domain
VGSPSRVVPILVAMVLAGCVLPPLATPTPTPSLTPSPSPSATPTSVPSPSPSATPDLGAVPEFSAGDLVTTAIDGLRVRQRPGLGSNVVTGLLPLGAELQVVMGPIPTDELGWYLVADAEAADPEFGEGWIAAGFEPDAWLTSTGETAGGTPYIASFAFTGDADNGPVKIGSGDHAIRWVAVDPERTSCQFAVSLAEGGGDPVPAIHATIGNDLVPGTLQPGGFDALGVRGQVFVTVASDCAWALVIEHVVEPEPSEPP